MRVNGEIWKVLFLQIIHHLVGWIGKDLELLQIHLVQVLLQRLSILGRQGVLNDRGRLLLVVRQEIGLAKGSPGAAKQVNQGRFVGLELIVEPSGEILAELHGGGG